MKYGIGLSFWSFLSLAFRLLIVRVRLRSCASNCTVAVVRQQSIGVGQLVRFPSFVSVQTVQSAHAFELKKRES